MEEKPEEDPALRLLPVCEPLCASLSDVSVAACVPPANGFHAVPHYSPSSIASRIPGSPAPTPREVLLTLALGERAAAARRRHGRPPAP